MLFSVIVGNQQKVGNEWEVRKDEYENSYVHNDSIRQRIRLGKNVPKHLNVDYSCANVIAFHFDDEEATAADAQYADVKAYKVASKTFISNNNKNMNLALLNFYSKDKEVMEAHKDDNIIYLTMVTDNYQLIDYIAAEDVEIIQTYRKKALYQGCVITFKDGTELPENGEVIYLYVKDLVKNRYVAIRISIVEIGEGKVRLTVNKEGINKDYLKTLIKTHKKLESMKRQMQFKIQVPAGKLLTRVYISDADAADELQEILNEKEISNYTIIPMSKNDDYTKDPVLKGQFDQEIAKERVRAVTTYKTTLPRTFCKDYNIMYLFDYDKESDQLKCLKSN